MVGDSGTQPRGGAPGQGDDCQQTVHTLHPRGSLDCCISGAARNKVETETNGALLKPLTFSLRQPIRMSAESRGKSSSTRWTAHRFSRSHVKNHARDSQWAYLTEQPYGRLVGVLTGLPAIASCSACET